MGKGRGESGEGEDVWKKGEERGEKAKWDS
jgi:hypothetical protein